MDPMRGVSSGRRGASPPKQSVAGTQDEPEQILDAFKAAALSVTKLYKISAATEAKARSYGYQDCLEDLLALLDRDDMGWDDAETSKIRRWARDKLDGRESVSQESEDEAEKPETIPSPELTSASGAMRNEDPVKRDASSPAPVPPITEEPVIFIPPALDNFTFQSSHQYPQLENLALSDTRSHDGLSTSHNTSSHNNATATTPSSRQSRMRGNRTPGSRSSHLGRVAGQKRKINMADFFPVSGLGYGKDPFGGPGNKRNRHI